MVIAVPIYRVTIQKQSLSKKAKISKKPDKVANIATADKNTNV